ncbi:protein FAR-RED IMPAIRED RESPONSE 1-like [Rhizophagus clarus]|uniref:Protein FAR-RED IMPAIRED RESPONSE 1-like n=1 Tax=Rhizophagus clarus TaxID=94130 RepID=A0A8H3LBW8_9GLOM|nr:protein FAR-RED IMPAIRED RESPONSE 1-like [Rhizophagus clarus]
MEGCNALQQEPDRSTDIILGSELENFDSVTNPIELFIGLRFDTWEIAERYLKEYGRQNGFVVNQHRVEFVEFHDCQSENSSILNEIECAVVYGCCNAFTIRNLLQPLYPNQLFLTQDLSNAIQKIKREKQITGSDASQLLKFLLEQQKEEPMITNKYNFPLSLFILVDNDGKLRLGAQAFLNDETQESYEWILQQTLDATGIEPKVIIIDMDPAIDAACQTTYSNAYHVHCIWHMAQNLPKRLKNKLGTTDFKEFIHDFWKTCNSLCVEVFEQRFQTLLNKFPNGNDYLHDPIYLTRHSWARAFTSRVFTADMQSTQRIESINSIIHKVVSSSSTMANVAEALDSRMQKEEMNKSFIAWKYQSTMYYQPFVVENFFSNINSIIQKYLSPQIVEEIHKQMCESVLYRCEMLDIEDAFKFDEDQLDQNEISENQAMTNGQEEVNNIEEYYDYWQTYLKALINSVPKESIKEVWQIISYLVSNSYQHVIILNDRTHLCTCLLLVSHGIICRHYFKLMIENPNALFHILLMPTRWLQDDAWNQIDLISNKPFIGTSSKNLKSTSNSDPRIYPIPKHHNNIQEVEVRHHTQKKQNKTQSVKRKTLKDNDNQNLSNEFKTSDGHVYNVNDIEDPIKCQGKGRPSIKRLKACNEQRGIDKAPKENVYHEDDNSSGRKCRDRKL